MKAGEIELAGVGAELVNVNFHICVNISGVWWLEEDFTQELLYNFGFIEQDHLSD